jgi:CheY-like chemotaxis protein
MMRRNVLVESRLIDDLLDLTRISQGKLSVELQPVDFHQVVLEAVETCRTQVAHTHMKVALDATEHMVNGDAGRLQQVIRNLLQNAARFTPDGGTIKLRTTNRQSGMLSVLCRDTGKGIAPTDLGRIFRAFEQAGRSLKRGYGGLGLGLAICKALVEAHGGKITAWSEGYGTGATFEVALSTVPVGTPLPKAELPSAPTGRIVRPVAAGSSPLHILLVEDHRDTRQMLERLLKRFGYEVDTAKNARIAKERIATADFDLFISDLGLPDESGLALVQAIHECQSIPAIALSGFGGESDRKRSRAAGFAAHLVKPIEIAELREVIEQLSPKAEDGEDG